MQWLHANTRGPWVSDKLPLTVCSCELALTLGELLAVLVRGLHSDLVTDSTGGGSKRGGYLEKWTIYSMVFFLFFFLRCHGQQLMFAATGPGKKILKKALQYTHMTNSLPEYQNRSGVSSWPTGGRSLGGLRREIQELKQVWYQSDTGSVLSNEQSVWIHLEDFLLPTPLFKTGWATA